MRRTLFVLFSLGALALAEPIVSAQGGCTGGGGGNNGGGGPPPPPPPPPGGGGSSGGSSGGGNPGGPGNSNPNAPLSGGGGAGGPGDTLPGGATSPRRRGPGAPTARPSSKPTAPTSPRQPKVPVDDSVWSVWWEMNQHPYLQLRGHLSRDGVATGSDELYLGRGETRASAQGDLRPDEAVTRGRVAPALAALLQESTNPDVLAACLTGLGRLGPDADATTTLSAHLAHSNREVREAALVGIGLRADAQSAFLLADIVDDRPRARELVGSTSVDDRTRAFAAYALALLCDRTDREDLRRYAVSRLTQALEGEAGDQQEVAVACVTAIGLSPLADGATASRAAATSSLAGQVQWLLGAFEDFDDRLVRSHAATALARLAADLPDGSPARDEAIEALARVAGPRAREANEVQQAAVLALGTLADGDMDKVDHDARELLEDCAARNGDAALRHFALVALAQASTRPGRGALEGPRPTRALLLKQLSRGKSQARPWAALALGLVERGCLDAGAPPSREVQMALRRFLRDARSPDEVGASAVALGLARDAEALDLLVERLADVSDEETRAHLAIAIGMLDDPRGLEALAALGAESTSRPLLLREASRAAGLLGDHGLVGRLNEGLADAGTFARQSAHASALAEVGDVRSVEGLLSLLRDEGATSGARAFAADALARICDPSPLPRETGLVLGVNYRAATASFTNPEGTGVVDVL